MHTCKSTKMRVRCICLRATWEEMYVRKFVDTFRSPQIAIIGEAIHLFIQVDKRLLDIHIGSHMRMVVYGRGDDCSV